MIFLFIPFFCKGQVYSDTYRLYKDGDEYQKPNVYLSGNSFEKIYEDYSKRIFFISKHERFLHDPNVHRSYFLDQNEIKNLNLQEIKNLHELERKEYLEKAEIIEEQIGKRPIPPINHFILNVFIFKKEKRGYCAYEVQWL